jgi:pentafunctional AROM polypeptide
LEIDGTGLRGGKIELAADVSSQFVSSILLSAPYANAPVTLQLDPHKEVVSQPYIDMTVSLMRDFGVDVQVSADKRTYTIPKRPYKNPPHFDVESDASSSTYPLTMAAITGGKVTALNVTSKSLQGDAQFCKVLEKMGCTVSQDEHKTIVEGPKDGQLRAVDVNMGDLTDAFMGIACLAAVAQGTTRITGIANQRVKECNRIQVMVEELSKLGVTCRELEDGVEVEGMGLDKFKPWSISCYNDHRIAMSFACLGCRVPNITIKDKECVQKTYPEFWDDLGSAFGVQLTVPPIDVAVSATQHNGK